MQWETSITEWCIWTFMLKIINQWEKTNGPASSQVSLAVPRTAHLNGRQKTCPPNALVLSSCVIPLYHLYLMLDQKNPIRHQFTWSRSVSVPNHSRNQPRNSLLASYHWSERGLGITRVAQGIYFITFANWSVKCSSTLFLSINCFRSMQKYSTAVQ